MHLRGFAGGSLQHAGGDPGGFFFCGKNREKCDVVWRKPWETPGFYMILYDFIWFYMILYDFMDQYLLNPINI